MANFDLVADVSSYQPDTREFFKALKDKGVKAVIVKITEGSNPGSAYVNPKAKNQISFAREVGLLVHAYHYAKFNGVADAQAEADWFVKNARKLGIGAESVMVLDYEDHATAKANGTADINAFIQKVKNSGYPNTDVYSMRSWFQDGHIDRNKIIPKNLWVAAYGTDRPGLDNVGTWQFTSEYQVADTKVDMSYDFKGFLSLFIHEGFQQFVFFLLLKEAEITLSLYLVFETIEFCDIHLTQLNSFADAALILQLEDTGW